MCSELSWCLNRSEFKQKFGRAIIDIPSIDLNKFNKILLRKRFIPMVNQMEIESKRVNLAFTVFQIITTLGSILVPAMIAIEDKAILFNSTSFDIEQQSHSLYWATWTISIAVTVSNAFNQLLGLERKYIMRNIHVSQIKKEGWQFLQKSGDIYGKFVNNNCNEFIHIFWRRIEKLRHNQIIADLSFDKFEDLKDDCEYQYQSITLSQTENDETIENKIINTEHTSPIKEKLAERRRLKDTSTNITMEVNTSDTSIKIPDNTIKSTTI